MAVFQGVTGRGWSKAPVTTARPLEEAFVKLEEEFEEEEGSWPIPEASVRPGAEEGAEMDEGECLGAVTEG